MKEKSHKDGLTDPDKIFTLEEMAQGDNVIFCASGVTDGEMLRGVRFTRRGAVTNSVVMRAKSRTVRWITSAIILTTNQITNDR